MGPYVHVLGLLLAAAISAGVAAWIRRQTRDHAGTAMVLLLCSHAAAGVLASLQILATDRTLMIAVYQIRYSVALFTFVLWLLVAIYYTGRSHWLTRPVWAVLLGPPVGIALLTLTDPIHGWMVVEYQVQTEPFTYVLPEFSTLALVVGTPLFFYFAFALGLFLRMFLFSRRSYRGQTAAVVVGMGAVLGTMTLSGTDLVAAPGFSYTVYGSAVFGVLVGIALFRANMFAVLPMARGAVFESIEDGILIVDGDYRVIDFNDRVRELFPDVGEAVDEPLDDAYPGLLAPVDGSRNDGGGARAIVDGIDGSADSPFAGTVAVTTGEDTRRLRVSVSEITNGGEPRGYALVMRDVTNLEEYATALEEKTAELEGKTAKLEQFAGVLSHDLRNPVSVAKGYVEHAVDVGDPELAQEALPALERIDTTIENLLALSRDGDTIDDPDVTQLASVVDRAWETSDTGVATLANEVPPDVQCYADTERLRTLLENLFRNAVDHGGDSVWVGITEEGFYVADDGPGIPEHERGQVFEGGYTTSGDGTGLGLAIVRSVAEAHDWHVEIRESDASGTRFEFEGVEVLLDQTDRARV